MADQFDRAQELDAYYRQQALEQHHERLQHQGAARTHCLECGGEIPEARRNIPGIDVLHCIDCAEQLEFQSQRRP